MTISSPIDDSDDDDGCDDTSTQDSSFRRWGDGAFDRAGAGAGAVVVTAWGIEAGTGTRLPPRCRARSSPWRFWASFEAMVQQTVRLQKAMGDGGGRSIDVRLC